MSPRPSRKSSGETGSFAGARLAAGGRVPRSGRESRDCGFPVPLGRPGVLERPLPPRWGRLEEAPGFEPPRGGLLDDDERLFELPEEDTG